MINEILRRNNTSFSGAPARRIVNNYTQGIHLVETNTRPVIETKSWAKMYDLPAFRKTHEVIKKKEKALQEARQKLIDVFESFKSKLLKKEEKKQSTFQRRLNEILLDKKHANETNIPEWKKEKMARKQQTRALKKEREAEELKRKKEAQARRQSEILFSEWEKEQNAKRDLTAKTPEKRIEERLKSREDKVRSKQIKELACQEQEEERLKRLEDRRNATPAISTKEPKKDTTGKRYLRKSLSQDDKARLQREKEKVFVPKVTLTDDQVKTLDKLAEELRNQRKLEHERELKVKAVLRAEASVRAHKQELEKAQLKLNLAEQKAEKSVDQAAHIHAWVNENDRNVLSKKALAKTADLAEEHVANAAEMSAKVGRLRMLSEKANIRAAKLSEECPKEWIDEFFAKKQPQKGSPDPLTQQILDTGQSPVIKPENGSVINNSSSVPTDSFAEGMKQRLNLRENDKQIRAELRKTLRKYKDGEMDEEVVPTGRELVNSLRTSTANQGSSHKSVIEWEVPEFDVDGNPIGKANKQHSSAKPPVSSQDDWIMPEFEYEPTSSTPQITVKDNKLTPQQILEARKKLLNNK